MNTDYLPLSGNHTTQFLSQLLNDILRVQNCTLQKYILCLLKMNTMQLVTPGGNHCCLMANDVQTIQGWFIHLLILSTVYEHEKQKTIVY